MRAWWLAWLVLAGCGERVLEPSVRTHDDQPLAPPPVECGAALADGTCRMWAALTVGDDGRSERFAFVVPPGARSIAVEAVGADGAVYALAELTAPDGTDQVALPPVEDLRTLLRDTFNDNVGRMPGALCQTIRLGTFPHVFPPAPSPAPSAGTWSLRLAGDTPGPVELRLAFHPDDGARTLHLNLVGVAEAAWSPDDAVAAAQAILDPAGIVLAVDATPALASPLAVIDEPFGTVPGPSSQMVTLAKEARPLGAPDALPVLVIDRFDANPNVTGESLGTPGPDDPQSYYFAVLVVANSDAASMGRSLAHELCHFLGLQHTRNVAVDGVVWPDPIDDTDPDVPNLMGPTLGTALTPGQIAVVQRSPLLR